MLPPTDNTGIVSAFPRDFFTLVLYKWPQNYTKKGNLKKIFSSLATYLILLDKSTVHYRHYLLVIRYTVIIIIVANTVILILMLLL